MNDQRSLAEQLNELKILGVSSGLYNAVDWLTARALGKGVDGDIATMLLREVMGCEMKHDENGHAYIKVPSRSLFDLGAQISSFLQSLPHPPTQPQDTP